MTTEEKELLIMDICSRIPYSVKMNETYEKINNHLDFCKPYLLPISSTNEEPKKELYKLRWYVDGDKIIIM